LGRFALGLRILGLAFGLGFGRFEASFFVCLLIYFGVAMNTASTATKAPIPAASPHTMNTFGRLPVALSHGRGLRVWDVNGREYLDALAGIAVNTLGHAHPKLVAALQDQVGKMMHCCNYYHIPDQERLAAELVRLSGMTNVFFCNSGLEANETALKLARKFGHDKGITRPEIVVYDNSFHGRSIATLSATGNTKVQQGFGPLVEGFIRVPMNDIAALKTATANNPNVVAVFFETIQGEGGVNAMNVAYLQEIRALCDANDWLLMIDEVQCGMGRTGKWFAHQWAGIVPDVMPLAKGLCSGLPVGAVVAGPRAANIFQPGNHGGTFGGGPLVMRAGVETLRIMQDGDLLGNAARMGERFRAGIRQGLAAEMASGAVKELRGMGLMIGIELNRPCAVLTERALDAGLLISVTADRVVRLLPALIITEAEVDEVLHRLLPLIQTFLAESI
jgi:acetylornithine/N-succinyldiaminopimelate aminotransferase